MSNELESQFLEFYEPIHKTQKKRRRIVWVVSSLIAASFIVLYLFVFVFGDKASGHSALIDSRILRPNISLSKSVHKAFSTKDTTSEPLKHKSPNEAISKPIPPSVGLISVPQTVEGISAEDEVEGNIAYSPIYLADRDNGAIAHETNDENYENHIETDYFEGDNEAFEEPEAFDTEVTDFIVDDSASESPREVGTDTDYSDTNTCDTSNSDTDKNETDHNDSTLVD